MQKAKWSMSFWDSEKKNKQQIDSYFVKIRLLFFD